MNDMTTRTSGAVATASDFNVFEQYADAVGGNRIVGDLLKFSKGDWLVGREGDEVPVGTRYVANVAELKVGWMKWEDGKPTDSRMGRVIDAFVPPSRSSLGDTDQDAWELDNDDKPRDPWQLTNTLILKAEKSDDLFTFSTSSKGGIGAIGKVAGEFGKHMRARPNELPIIALDVDSYKHSDKTRGRIKVPVFKVAGWTDKSAFDAALAAEEAAAAESADEEDGFADAPFEDAPAPAAKAGRSKEATAKTQF